MTGTGTKDDPYIVDNWTEYINMTPNAGSSTYVEFNPNVQNKVIDFNDIQPDGFSTSIKFVQYINFNGWTLKNFHSIASTAIKIANSGEFSNLILENFYYCPQSSIASLIECIDGKATAKNCIISGQIQTQNKISNLVSGVIRESSLNIIVNAGGTVKIANHITNSEIVLDVSAESLTLCTGKLTNSRISGKVQSSENTAIVAGNTSSAYNVFNVQSDKAIDYQGKGISVYNSDISSSARTEEDMKTQGIDFKGCTAEQLRDAQYLYNLHFPIGVE